MADGGDTAGLRTRPLWRDGLLVGALYVVCAAPVAVTGDQFTLDVLVSVPFGAALVTLSVIDLRRFILPDYLTLPLILSGLAASWLFSWDDVFARALAAVIGFLLLFLAANAYRRLRGTDGLGLGDAKLYAASGAWLGLAALPQVLLVACLLALAGVIALLASGRRLTMKSAIPFGPFLAFATWLVWLYGNW